MILPKGVTAKNLTTTFAEQQLKEHLRENKETIRALLAIPPHEFGVQETGSIGSEETAKQLRNFYESTIIPYQELISGAFTKSFKRELGNRFFYQFNNDDVGVLRENDKNKAETANLMLSTMTMNEVRERVWQMEPLEGGDALPGSSKPTIPGFSAFSKTQVEEKGILSNKSEKLKRFLEDNWDWWNRRKAAGEEGAIKKEEGIFLEQLLGIFADYAPVAVKEFNKVFKASKGKTKQSEEEKRALYKKNLDRAFSARRFRERYTENNVKTLENTQNLGYDLAINVPFKLPNQEEREALRVENEAARKAALEARALDSFEGFTSTTTSQIVDLVSKGTEEGLSLSKIAQSIKNYFGESAIRRSQTIARTEVLGAVSLGQAAAAEDAMEVIPGMEKMWITAGDDRVRDSHSELDGERIPMNEEFKSGLSYPRDPEASASETINCRCTWLMIPPDADLDTGGIDFTGLGRRG
jgi:hypothetical protein